MAIPAIDTANCNTLLDAADVRLEHVSAGCNSVTGALDWGIDGLVAYAAHDAIFLYNSKEGRITGQLTGHTARVNCVKWLSVPPEATAEEPHGGVPEAGGEHQQHQRTAYLASGSCDGTVRVWAVHQPCGCGNEPPPGLEMLATLEGHQAPVASLATITAGGATSQEAGSAVGVPPSSPLAILLISVAGDGQVLVWRCQLSGVSARGDAGGAGAGLAQGGWALQQSLPPAGSRMQLCAAVAELPGAPGWLVLACGGVDGCVRLYVAPPGGDFELSCLLAGHQDWVKSIDLVRDDVNGLGKPARLLIASGSQDRYIRIWAVERRQWQQQEAGPAAAPSITEEITRYAPKPRMAAGGCSYETRALAVLAGHEDWVHCVRFLPHATATSHSRINGGSTEEQGAAATAPAGRSSEVDSSSNGPGGGGSSSGIKRGRGGAGSSTRRPALLSCAMDRTMAVWRPDPTAGLWVAEETMGDAGGSASLGYFTCCWGKGGGAVLAHGYTGALHMWERQPQRLRAMQPPPLTQQQQRNDEQEPQAANRTEEEGERDGAKGEEQEEEEGMCVWEPRVACGGHYGAVTDLMWAFDGCLLSCGADQTTRLSVGLPDGRWCELARPQVHGHDLSCLAALPITDAAGDATTVAPAKRWCFASGSEEKVVRVLEAPRAFLESLAAANGSRAAAAAAAASSSQTALGASIAALGLSNRAVYDDEVGDGPGDGGDDLASGSGAEGVELGLGGGGGGLYAEGPDLAPAAAPRAIDGPPLEEHLQQSSLWPEVHKLYGHGNDLYCLAADPLGQYFASACRAQSKATAAVWFWNTARWTAAGPPVECHTLTVTQLAFSPDGRHLLTASRDRSIALLQRRGAAEEPAGALAADQKCPPFEVVARIPKAHARIVWGVCWAPGGRLVASCSRDGTVKLWAMAEVAAGAPGSPQQQQQQLALHPKPLAQIGPLPSAATSIAFAPLLGGERAAGGGSGGGSGGGGEDGGGGSGADGPSRLLLAVGQESGALSLFSVLVSGAVCGQSSTPSGHQSQRQEGGALPVVHSTSCVWEAGPCMQHVAAVRRIGWRHDHHHEQQQRRGGTGAAEACGEGNSLCWMATCSSDHSVRVFSVRA